ncbi:MAG: TetR/AcrR family transcriptional regulator [Hyphomicrobiales bacterium]|nr:MAG: TetR/AcrR family transcriptional regulator [Hyphomicrobiales bacterium]
MPTPAKTSLPELIDIGRTLVDEGGADALTVSAVAQGAGVKAPSLYKHFTDRAALLKAVEISILKDLEATLRAETKGRTPRVRLRSMADSYRRFAKTQPQRYALLYGHDALADPIIVEACRVAAQPLLEELRAAGIAETRMLPLARTITAFLHGFVSMEIAHAFRLGGDLEADFAASVETILQGVG